MFTLVTELPLARVRVGIAFTIAIYNPLHPSVVVLKISMSRDELVTMV